MSTYAIIIMIRYSIRRNLSIEASSYGCFQAAEKGRSSYPRSMAKADIELGSLVSCTCIQPPPQIADGASWQATYFHESQATSRSFVEMLIDGTGPSAGALHPVVDVQPLGGREPPRPTNAQHDTGRNVHADHQQPQYVVGGAATTDSESLSHVALRQQFCIPRGSR